jgi:hypothetical protein
MNDTHEVISAFLDDEPFDAAALAQALSAPAGRDLLIELVALRHLAQPDATPVRAVAPHRTRPALRALVAVAAMLVALVAGYAVGDRRAAQDHPNLPSPTRVVEATAWQPVSSGGQQ